MERKFTGNKDVDYMILKQLDDEDLFNTCISNQHLNQLCSNESFWEERYLRKFNLEDGVKLPYNWRKSYLMAVKDPRMYNMELLKANYDFKSILDTHFRNLPRWVNKQLFYEDQINEMAGSLADAYTFDKEGNWYNFEYVLGTPLVSDLMDIGSGGGLEGKYDEDDFAVELPEELFESLV